MMPRPFIACQEERRPTTMPKPMTIEDSTFQTEVLESTVPVLVDFWAEWCPPCKKVDPLLDELASEYDGQVRFTRLNADENYDAVVRYGVHSLPTLLIFRGGREVGRQVGYAPRPQLKRQIDRALGGTTT
jgi:thioredoxin 1